MVKEDHQYSIIHSVTFKSCVFTLLFIYYELHHGDLVSYENRSIFFSYERQKEMDRNCRLMKTDLFVFKGRCVCSIDTDSSCQRANSQCLGNIHDLGFTHLLRLISHLPFLSSEKFYFHSWLKQSPHRGKEYFSAYLIVLWWKYWNTEWG